MVVTLDSHAGVHGSNPVRFQYVTFFFRFITTLKLHFFFFVHKISLVSPNCYFLFYFLFIFFSYSFHMYFHQ